MVESEQASSPCFADQLVLGDRGYEAVDRQTEIDVARWRRGERERLVNARLAVPMEERKKVAELVCGGLDRIVSEFECPVISVYWPFRGELDLRGWMAEKSEGGAAIVLPVVAERGKPLVFRRWRPGCRMERGVWNIPFPAEDERLAPEIVVSPVVGVDEDGYRLGYGGGFYDRTLASMADRPLVIGVGHPVAEIKTIFPQPHDIPMDRILVGRKEWKRKQ